MTKEIENLVQKVKQNSSVELVALGLLAALILVLALPLFSEILISEDNINSRYKKPITSK